MKLSTITGLIALAPMVTGPLPQDEGGLTLALCLGGEITIPMRDSDDGEKERKRDCHQQGCHAGCCREKYGKSKGQKRAR